LKVYPNPAHDVVSISGLTGGEIITFLDVTGRKCLEWKAFNPKEDISASHLAKGTYLVVIKKDKTERTIKVVID